MAFLSIIIVTGLLAGAVIFSRIFRDVRAPLLTYLGAYAGTTAIGAAGLLDPLGREQFTLFIPDFDPARFQYLGSSLYWTLLLAPFVLVPLGAKAGAALAGGGLGSKLVQTVPLDDKRLLQIFYAIALAALGYALLKLAQTGNLFPSYFWDRSLSCQDRLLRRTELFGELRYLYYAATFAILPIAAVVSLLQWINTSTKRNFGVFVFFLVASLYLNSIVLMKANIVILVGILLLACIVAGVATLRHYIVFGVLAVGSLALMELVLLCYAAPPLATPSEEVAALSTPAPTSKPTSTAAPAPKQPATPKGPSATPGTKLDAKSVSPTDRSEPADKPSGPEFLPESKPEPKSRPKTKERVIFSDPVMEQRARVVAGLVRNVAFRMAASFPYYVEIFSDPDERCGLESNRLPLFPSEQCLGPTKIFPLMYPKVTFVQGFAPAAAHVSAYGELGFVYAIVVLILGGAILGFVWRIGLYRPTPLFMGLGTAACVFAYYLSQVSLVGALTYSHGLIWYVFPVGVALLIGAVSVRRAALLQLVRNPPVRQWAQNAASLRWAQGAMKPAYLAGAALALSILTATIVMVPSLANYVRPNGSAASQSREDRLTAELASLRAAIEHRDQADLKRVEMLTALIRKLEAAVAAQTEVRGEIVSLQKRVNEQIAALKTQISGLQKSLSKAPPAAKPRQKKRRR
jgi:hypothetical protein